MIVLDKWQEEVLAHEGDIGLCTGRRVGKTYILARKCVDHMVKYGKPVIVVSLTEDQAEIILQMAKTHIQDYYPKLIGKGQYRPQSKKIWIMREGKPIKMISRPVGSTGDATRGFEGGILMVDEASRMPRLFWIAALPVLLTCNGEIWMCSTPHGKQGYFWKRFNESWNLKEKDARFKFFYTTTEKVMKERPLSEGWTQKIKDGAYRIMEADRKDWSEIEFGQEYLGLFLDEILGLFDDDWLEKVCHVIEPKEGCIPVEGRDYFGGVDVGRVIDPSTFEIVDGTGEHIYQVHHSEKKKPKDGKMFKITETARETKRLHMIWEMNKIGIDSTGMGAGVLDILLEDPETEREVCGMENGVKIVDDEETTKPLLGIDMWIHMLRLGEQGKLHLFKDLGLMASLKSVRQVYRGNKTEITGDNTHAGEGLKRAIYLTKQKILKPFFASC